MNFKITLAENCSDFINNETAHDILKENLASATGVPTDAVSLNSVTCGSVNISFTIRVYGGNESDVAARLLRRGSRRSRLSSLANSFPRIERRMLG